ncbi:MAG: prephenate dehydrogenase [Lentisphaerae bacterium ADurb.BinA184]|nr:MAG: prephenate dehydrogenase [Lentisphaerae bacterium ADurb.BinA184]
MESRPRAPDPLPPAATVVIAGLGLLGGSLGLCLRRAGGVRVLGWARRPDAIREALALGAVDDGDTDADRLLAAADLTVICIPVQSTVEFAVAHADAWRPGTVVTDVGSLKRPMLESIRPVLRARGVAFVGSHPMAGSEQSGLAHADAELYRNAVVFVTPAADDGAAAVGEVESLWRRVGGLPNRMEAAAHDALVARTSHVLHLVAAAAVRVGSRDPQAAYGAAGGFRDVTRIAGASPGMWRQIFAMNRDEVLAALGEFRGELDRLEACLRAGDWAALEERLNQSRQAREHWFRQWQDVRKERP